MRATVTDSAFAQYHLTAHEALKRGPMGSRGSDTRCPQEILALMLQDERGLRILRQAIVDGRANRAPRLVDPSLSSLVHTSASPGRR